VKAERRGSETKGIEGGFCILGGLGCHFILHAEGAVEGSGVMGMVAYVCYLNYWEVEIGRTEF
jgi:hypothetical protein